ncbi:hypothetical protein [Mariniflexile sp. AS56]|uniref:hypothetical protein n=1 Tax=Mariniflexile sp. AS56 TaxID=3063957 RepID=UPI0026EC2F7D|nr:hypothetical protein [Mariniflexile sp. AS56]MDO7171334.1 hypothetical protein [Mariniflexile sp. AS56]
MKRTVFLIAGLLMALTTASATNSNDNNNDATYRNSYTQPIVFIEHDVEFLIFPDGSFDFNTNVRNNYSDSNSRRNSINVSYTGRNASVQYSSNNLNRGVSIDRDRDGTVRRIGNVNLNYDRYGKITRAGNIYIDYNRGNGLLMQVGGLYLNYSHRGEILTMHGHVNSYNTNCNMCGTASCSIDHSKSKGHHYNDKDDHHYKKDDHYYYKHDGKMKKYKKKKH